MLLILPILIFYSIVVLIQAVFALNLLYYAVIAIFLKPVNNNPKLKGFPSVTIQLPVYNEKYVVKRLIRAACKIDWPIDKLQIQVLDDSTDETKQIVKEHVNFFKKKGISIVHVTRKNRSGFKAGALKHGLKTATGEFVAIFDADFIPHKEFLIKTVPHFKKNIAFVQTRWDFINRDFSFLTRIQAIFLEGHFGVDQIVRNNKGYFFNFNGTAGIWRKAAIIDAGGWEHDTLTEDLDLSYRAQLKGWKCVYAGQIKTPSEVPVSINALRRQQQRWAQGSLECALKFLKKIFKSKLSFNKKLQATLHLSIYLYLILSFFVILLYPVVIYLTTIYPQLASLKKTSPFLIFLTLSPMLYFIVAQWKLHKKNIKNRIIDLALAPFVGTGMMITVLDAGRKALFSKNKIFERTPKFGISKDKGDWKNKKYQIKIFPLFKYEVLFLFYVIGTMIISIFYSNWLFLFYSSIYVLGLFGVIFYTIKQTWFIT